MCWSSWCYWLFSLYHNVCGPWWCTNFKFLACIHIHTDRLYSCFNSITYLACLMLDKCLMVLFMYENDATLMQQMACQYWTNRTFAVTRFNWTDASTVLRICVGRLVIIDASKHGLMCLCLLFIVFIFSEFCFLYFQLRFFCFSYFSFSRSTLTFISRIKY